ncbi:hypothetical protein ACMWIM_004168, partial [Citrobacter amalonaticus]
CRPDKRSAIRQFVASSLVLPDGGVNARSDLRETFISATKNAHHFSLFVNGFVTYSIVFFYLCMNLFLRYLWLALAFSAVRFNVRGIYRSDMQHFVRNFSYSARLLITKCCEILRYLFWCSGRSINFSAENTRLKFF